MARGNPGRVWEVKETGMLAFSYNKEQLPEFAAVKKVLVYITEKSQLSLFEDMPAKEQCRRVLKSIDTLKCIGFID
jgi:hypothetical protein